jgi:hypothetical protein
LVLDQSFASTCNFGRSATSRKFFQIESSQTEKMASKLAVVAILVATLACAHAFIGADEIQSLPGYGIPATKQYSGYLNVDPVNGRFLHYWFVTQADNNASAPVVLWMVGSLVLNT